VGLGFVTLMIRSARTQWPSLILLAGATVMPAAELVMRDIGVGLVLPPTNFSYDLTSSAGDRAGSDAFESAYGMELHGRYSLARPGDALGMVLGVAVASGRATYAGGGSWSEYTACGLLGSGWAVTDRLILLGEAKLGLGVGKLNLAGSDSMVAVSAAGPLVIGGVQASGHFSLSDSVVIGLGAGWQQTIASLSGDGVDATLKISGVTAFLSLDWRLSDRPFLLE
jgi:hypothetical protein